MNRHLTFVFSDSPQSPSRLVYNAYRLPPGLHSAVSERIESLICSLLVLLSSGINYVRIIPAFSPDLSHC